MPAQVNVLLVMPKITGWPPALLQDDSRKLHKWFASRLDARETVRKVCAEIERERMKTVVYSKENCPACVALKARLNRDGEPFTEIVVGVDLSREDFLERFPHVRMMPHLVFVNEE